MDGTATNGHHERVGEWMARATSLLAPPQLIEAFEAAFAALWRRANDTLGDVTVAAIVGRILYTATEQHAILAALSQAANGVRWERVGGHVDIRREEIAEPIQFVLEEFLRALGTLTGEILTPALHAELSKLALVTGGASTKPPSKAPGTKKGRRP